MPQALSSFGHEADPAKGPSFQPAVALGLAVIGAVIIVVQACGYLSWLFSSDFAAIRSPVAVPEDIKAIAHQAELSSIIGASLWLCFVAWGWSRKRTLTWPLLWTIAWALTFWQEPMVNVRHHTFSWNKALFNRGDWTTHLPFVPDSYSPMPEALILEGLVFLYLLPLFAMVIAALMKAMQRYLHITNKVMLVLLAWAAMGLADMKFEFGGIAKGLLAYVEIGGPALNAGSVTQWPIYEGVGVGLAWALPGMIMFFRRDVAMAAHNEVFPRWWQGRYAIPATLLAAVGLVNIIFGIYNAGYVMIMDGTVASLLPPWLAPVR